MHQTCQLDMCAASCSDDADTLSLWQTALQAAGRRPETYTEHARRVCSLRDAMGADSISDAVAHEGAPAKMVQLHGEKYSRHKDLIVAVRSLCYHVPGSVPEGTHERWTALHERYMRDPIEAAASALINMGARGADQFLRGWEAVDLTGGGHAPDMDGDSQDRRDRDSLESDAAGNADYSNNVEDEDSAENNGSEAEDPSTPYTPYVPQTEIDNSNLRRILDAALADPWSLRPSDNRRKRLKKQAKAGKAVALPSPNLHPLICELVSAQALLRGTAVAGAVPAGTGSGTAEVRLTNLEWSWMADSGPDNRLNLSAARGRVIALGLREADAVQTMTRVLFRGVGEKDATELVSPSRPQGGRGSAPKVSGQFTVGGSAYRAERIFSRRQDKRNGAVTWHQASKESSITPLSGAAPVTEGNKFGRDGNAFMDSLEVSTFSYSAADVLANPECLLMDSHALSIAKALADAVRASGGVSTAVCADARLTTEARAAVLRKLARKASEYLQALVDTTKFAVVSADEGGCICLDHGGMVVPAASASGHLADFAAWAIRAVGPQPVLTIRTHADVDPARVKTFVELVRAEDPSRAIILVGAPSRVRDACGTDCVSDDSGEGAKSGSLVVRI